MITQITGFQTNNATDCDEAIYFNQETSVEESDNFQLCEDFFVSNLLYHTFLDPREKVCVCYFIQKTFSKFYSDVAFVII